MGIHYLHFSLYERKCIHRWYHQDKLSCRKIAQRLARSHTSVSREIKRNISTDHYPRPIYYPHIAQGKYRCRMQVRKPREALKSAQTRAYVIDKLNLGWSPEIISGRLALENRMPCVCHEAIYQYIYKLAPELIEFLARRHKNRRKKYPDRKYKTTIADKTSITQRPEEINNRVTPGHWESDSIESKGRQSALNVLVERVSRLSHLAFLHAKTSLATRNAIIKRLSKHPDTWVQSITYDNGPENAQHLNINKALNCESYFCLPYHSWEKGAVEQVNGLIRRYLPKNTDFSKISSKTIRAIEFLLNSRPRKCLGYKTPFEVYYSMGGALLD